MKKTSTNQRSNLPTPGKDSAKFLTPVACALLLAGLGGQSAPTATAQGQIFSGFVATNGSNPYANLCAGLNGDFYGTTTSGGTKGGYGTVFTVTTNGWLSSLASFDNTNGADPQAGLALGTDGNFYGTTTGGGTNGGYGTVFRVTTNGTLTSLVSFANTNGAYPYSGLILGTDGNLYGTTYLGGSNGEGTVYKVTTDGVLTTLAAFANTNGANPHTGLVRGNNGDFYGTTTSGGTNGGYGTVFKLTAQGLLVPLVSLANFDGAYPEAVLAAGPDGNFYGTTYYGGSNSLGTIFRVSTNGSLTSLVSFAGANGANPMAGLTLGSDGHFYGTTYSGGDANLGTIFELTTNGSLTTLLSFAGTNGTYPHAGLTAGSDGNFYGVTAGGGSGGNGVVLKLVLPPTLNFQAVSNHWFQATLNGLARPSVQIQITTNWAASWSVLTNLVFTNGTGQFADPVAANVPRTFYRVMVK
jgi:uncharacterized repeat protein (TIGR03803 family)